VIVIPFFAFNLSPLIIPLKPDPYGNLPSDFLDLFFSSIKYPLFLIKIIYQNDTSHPDSPCFAGTLLAMKI